MADLYIDWLVLAETMREMADEMERKARHLRAKADYAEYKASAAKAEHTDGDGGAT